VSFGEREAETNVNEIIFGFEKFTKFFVCLAHALGSRPNVIVVSTLKNSAISHTQHIHRRRAERRAPTSKLECQLCAMKVLQGSKTSRKQPNIEHKFELCRELATAEPEPTLHTLLQLLAKAERDERIE
jgi:hypothetical protein